jgi:hypothetical protein
MGFQMVANDRSYYRHLAGPKFERAQAATLPSVEELYRQLSEADLQKTTLNASFEADVS